MAEQIDKLLTQKEVAVWLSCSEAWLEQSRFRKTGIPFIRIGRAIRYRTTAVNDYLMRQTVGAGI